MTLEKPLQWIATLALAVTTGTSAAVTIVAPGDLAGTEGNSNNAFPFNEFGGQRYQQVFDASHFGSTSGIIDQILFRVDDGDPSFSTAYDLEIRLSHTNVTPATLSTTFANNIGADETLVLDDGAYSASGTGGTGPNPFDIVFDIDNLFTYDGVSNLLLDITVFSGISGSQFDSTNRGAATDGMQRVWSTSGPNAATGAIGGDEGLVTAFVIGATVPVPTTLALLGLGFAGIGYRQHRKIKTA